MLETFNERTAKIIQVLPQQTANPGSRLTIGLTSITCHIDIMRLLFLWRILLLPMSSIYKKIVISRFLLCNNVITCGPVSLLYNTCKRHGLVDLVISSILKGKYISLNEWKRIVNLKVKDLDYRTCILKSFMYDTLGLLRCDQGKCLSQWWVHCSHDPSFTVKCCFIVKLLLQVSRLYIRRCKLCAERSSICHILFECHSLNIDSRLLWLNIRFPDGLRKSLEAYSNEDKTCFILNAFYIKYTLEWKDSYDDVINYVYYVVKCYDALCENVNS